MSYTIDQFIWGYQRHFQISLQSFAERLFNRLDPYLNPKVFLVGILIKDKENRHAICLEPEDCGYNQTDFKGIIQLEQQLEAVNAESRIFHSHPIAQEYYNLRIKYNSFREAILKIINRESSYDDILSYISFPTEKEGYLVFSVLQIKKSAYESHYRLNKDTYDDRYSISVSLIKSTINKFLESIPQELFDPNAGANLTFSKFESDDTIKSAGKEFMYSVASKGNNVYGLHGLFEACNIISSLKYEGEEGQGGLVISPKDHHNIKMELALDKPIKLNEYRKVRKFLELSDHNNLLISDSGVIFGVGQIVGRYNPVNEDLFVIRFNKHYHWEVSHDNNCLMKVSYNQPYLPETKIDRDKFYSDLQRIFQGIKKSDLDNIWIIVIEALSQKHGTILVVTNGAKEEAARLKDQCFTIDPIRLNESLTSKVTSIDGAVLLSSNGTCYAIGVILDGIATQKGDSSRGARYNSAIRYLEFIKEKYECVIVIISEDGMVDIVPDLMPQIKRGMIIEKINTLRGFMESKSNVSYKHFNLTIDWLYAHSFYLSKDQCDEVNSLRKDIEKRRENEGIHIQIIRVDLKPNEQMNESYFIE